MYCKDEIGSLIVDVEIHWLDRDSMKIALVHKEDFGIGSHAQYEVSCFFFFFGSVCENLTVANEIGFASSKIPRDCAQTVE
jgi:hypothetical protein